MNKGRFQHIDLEKASPYSVPEGRAWRRVGPQGVGSVPSALGLSPWDTLCPPTQRWTRCIYAKSSQSKIVSQKEGFPVSRPSSRGGRGSGKRLLPSSLAPAPSSSAQAILRTQIMPAVAAVHISFQSHRVLRGSVLPPPPERWPLCKVWASCSLYPPYPAGHCR